MHLWTMVGGRTAKKQLMVYKVFTVCIDTSAQLGHDKASPLLV